MKFTPSASIRPRHFRTTALVLSLITISAITNAPRAFSQSRASHLPNVFDSADLAWEIELGTHQYTVPRVDGNDLFIGVNDSNLQHKMAKSSGGGVFMCLDLMTGERRWQLPIPRNMNGTQEPFHFNHWKCGVCSRPAVDGDRLYIVGPRGDILCLDRNGQQDGNDGPFVNEADYMGITDGADYSLTPNDGDIIWQFDLIRQLDVVPHDVCGSSPVVLGDYVYACTSNGVDHTHSNVANPAAPSLIALNKHTGKLAAVDSANIGKKILHGQWSSPVAASFGDKTMVLFGGGDGVLYAFQPLGQQGESTVRSLNIVWKYDCCPKDYRYRDGHPITYSRWNKKRTDGPSEIIATPTVHDGRIYASIGQSPVHGPGRGMLSCIDGASGKRIWESREVGRTLSDAVVHDGLVYLADYSGHLHCFDAETGRRYWHHELLGGVWCATPIVVGDRVYIANENNRIWAFAVGKEKRIISKGRTRSVGITPVLADDILLIPTQKRLFAVNVKD